ncbi:MAG TPA: hypothetical protein VIC61_03815 [Gammaproteobacteria bacterium]|jgi:hypothetical protein
MPYEVGVDSANACIVVAHKGRISLAESRAAQAEALAVVVERNLPRVLIDVTGVTNDLSIIEMFIVSSEIDRPELPRPRGALLVRADQQPRGKFLETIADNRGLEIRSFTDRAEALAWLSAR